jgi:hypothetical protein
LKISCQNYEIQNVVFSIYLQKNIPSQKRKKNCVKKYGINMWLYITFPTQVVKELKKENAIGLL